MDTEALKSLAWIVIWGGLFFVMMRYGCGAHVGGHAHGDTRGGRSPPDLGRARDPVCGMDVDPASAPEKRVHRGATYFFCSQSCRQMFEQAPERYAAGSASSHGGHGEHGHGC